jgi:SAM-dependent methyltransferase
MKLSELVAYRTALENYDFQLESRPFIKKILEAKADIDHRSNTETNQQIVFGSGNYHNELDADLTQLKESIASLQDNFAYYKAQLDDIIREQQEEYIKQSEKMYIRDDLPNTKQSALDRMLTMDDKNTAHFLDRILQLSSWQYPGMVINPQDTSIIDDMASSDPLYIVDMNQTTLDTITGKMNDVYRHRVRPYVFSIIPRRKCFNDLPKEQFGLITVWNILNNLSLTMCEQVISQLFDLLRPGGTVLFTYNDCDNAHNVRNFENNFRQFTPGSRLVPIIEQLGYTVKFKTSSIHGWMEIQKPGTLNTIKGGQSLARVIHGDNAVIEAKKKYSKEEVEQIHQEAIALGIDNEKAIKDRAIEPGKLELLIKRRKHAMQEERNLIEQIGKQNSKDG